MCALNRKRAALAVAPNVAVAQPSHNAACAPSLAHQPKHKATMAAPVVWPLSRAKAIMPLAPLLRERGLLDKMAFKLGD